MNYKSVTSKAPLVMQKFFIYTNDYWSFAAFVTKCFLNFSNQNKNGVQAVLVLIH